MKRTLTLLSTLLVLVPSALYSQSWAWAKRFGGAGTFPSESATAMCTDAAGNSYVAGHFSGTSFTIGTTLMNFNTSGNNDVFVAKLDASGNVVWAKSFGSAANDAEGGITVDASGNIYLAGSFNSASLVLGGTTLTNSSSSASDDIFITKLDPSGNVIWAKSATGGTGANEACKGVVVDNIGGVYVAGMYDANTVTFGSYSLTYSGGGSYIWDIFLVKLDASNGAYQWAKKIGGTNYDRVQDIVFDGSSSLYLAGYFQGNITVGSTNLVNKGGTNADILLVKYDLSGNVLWARNAGGADHDLGNGVAVDPAGNVYVGCEYGYPSMSFAGKTLNNVGTANTRDMAVLKYDSNGNERWAVRGGGTDQDMGGKMETDASANVYISTASNSYNLTFGSSNFTGYSVSKYDIYISKLDSTGNFKWTTQAGGTGSDYANDIGLDASGGIYTTGGFLSVPCNFGSYAISCSPINYYDVQVSKIGQVVAPVAAFTMSSGSICAGSCITLTDNSTNTPTTWSWSFPGGNPSSSTLQNPNNVCYGTAGTYTITLTASNTGGSNTLTKAITVSAIPNVTSSGGTTICEGDAASLNAGGAATYSWAPGGMTGASISVSPTVTTTYTVTGTASGCSNTSAVTVSVNPKPAAPVITQNGTFLQSTSAVSYQWYLNGGILSGAINQTYTFTQNGNYTVVITDVNGCTNVSAIYVVTTTGIQASDRGSEISVMPNPNKGVFSIALNNTTSLEAEVALFDMLGRNVMIIASGTLNAGYHKEINIEALGTGVYFLRVSSAEGTVTKKIIKN